jgi:hypothetical protein
MRIGPPRLLGTIIGGLRASGKFRTQIGQGWLAGDLSAFLRTTSSM